MFNNQTNFSDTYEREKLRILQTLNVQIQSMAVKLDQIVTQVEENVFKIKSYPPKTATPTTTSTTLISAGSASTLIPIQQQQQPQQQQQLADSNNNNLISLDQLQPINSSNHNNNNNNKPSVLNSVTLTPINTNLLAPVTTHTNSNNGYSSSSGGRLELSSNHQLVKIIDQPMNEASTQVISSIAQQQQQQQHISTQASAPAPKKTKGTRGQNKRSQSAVKKSIQNLVKNSNNNNNNNSNNNNSNSNSNNNITNGTSGGENILNNVVSSSATQATTQPSATKVPDISAKRNKQQRQFNTFVRESINQLLGSDFMKTHDVQDIDQQVMEMIRKEAVENYLPDNIRPRRAWHLAKASLRTLKRTLNNRKHWTKAKKKPLKINHINTHIN